MRHVLDTIGGLVCLARLGAQSRFRLRGRYWAWRRETAFGHDADAIPASSRRHAMMDYARWVFRMRRWR